MHRRGELNEATNQAANARASQTSQHANLINAQVTLGSLQNQAKEQLGQIESNLNQKGQNTQNTFQNILSILNDYRRVEKITLTPGLVMARVLTPEELSHTEVLKDACKTQHLDEFKAALDKLGDNINFQDDNGKTILMYAASNAFYQGVEELLQRGADVNILDNNGANALIHYANSPYTSFFLEIANRTNDLNYQAPGLNDNSVLHTIVAGARNIIYTNELDAHVQGDKLVLENSSIGGDALVCTASCSFNISAPVISKFPSGYNIFENKGLKLIKALVSKGANINIQNAQGMTPFFLSCAYKFKYLTHQLLDNFSIDLTIIDHNGWNALFWSLEFRDKSLFQKLIDKGANINAQDKNGYTCLFWTAMYNWEDGAEWFIQHGADVNKSNNEEVSPLYASLGYFTPNNVGNPEVTKHLLEHGADVNQPMNDGDTPMHMTGYRANIPGIKLLYQLN